MELCVNSKKEESFENPISVELVKTKSEMFFSNGYLPDWFLIEVLSRLPVKCVFRYKSVSKRWRFLISATSFASLYISRASLVTPWTILANTLCVNMKIGSFLAQSFLPDLVSDNWLHSRFSIVHFPNMVGSSEVGEGCNVVGVSDGLVLYDCGVGEEVSDYHIYNPMTGCCVAIPRTCTRFGDVSTGFIMKSEGGSLTSYKVVRLDCQFGESYVLKFEVFSSETGRWRRVVVYMDVAIEVVWLRRPVALNGKLHWIDRRHGILVFNPFDDFNQCRVIGLPGDIDEQCIDARNNGRSVLFDVHQGQLRYVEASVVSVYPFGFSGISVWVLDEYDSSSWTLQHKVKIKDISFDDILISKALNGTIPTPIAFHPLDANIFYLGFGDTIASYNMKTLKLDALVDPDDIRDTLQRNGRSSLRKTPCWSSAFLFTLPPWPISLPIKKRNSK
ncbi:putative F-box/kelch-repeat protein At1g15680 [Solanum tuberosum]|uniref:F-box/kelch-repeat protein n=1 Tax=Solanum tuberosum TaxID=4113 RepID=M1CC90_SOLTU|nr:PREDICTED: putative F-box/kelch-repeat protein At1g15680 [Solanum tuberosum]